MKLTTPFAVIQLVAGICVLTYFIGWQTALAVVATNVVIEITLIVLQHLICHPS
jgi:hypothetical protein